MIIVDDFVKDDKLLKDIKNDKNFFTPNGKVMWWDGWWNSEPTTVKKRLIEVMWKYHSPWDFPRYNSITGLVGFEYGTSVYGEGHSNPGLGQYHDKDEFPVTGTIYYPVEHEFDGGFLEIYTNGKDKDPERIAAKFNRLVILDVGEYLHRVTDVTKGTQLAIAVNLWRMEPKAVQSGNFIIE